VSVAAKQGQARSGWLAGVIWVAGCAPA